MAGRLTIPFDRIAIGEAPRIEAVKLFDSQKGRIGAVVEGSASNVRKMMSRQKVRETVEVPHPEVSVGVQAFVENAQEPA